MKWNLCCDNLYEKKKIYNKFTNIMLKSINKKKNSFKASLIRTQFAAKRE